MEEERIRKEAHKIYLERVKNEFHGTPKSDWELAKLRVWEQMFWEEKKKGISIVN